MNLTGEALEKWKEGKARSLETKRRLKAQRIEEYNKNPILCLSCRVPLSYDCKIKGQKFCNSSCAATYNNSKDGPWDQKEYYARTREQFLERNRKWREANPEHHSELSIKSAKGRKFRDPANYLLRSAEIRAKKKGLPFGLAKEDVVIPEHCPVLGIPLYFRDDGRINNTPTIDRIIPEKGYVKGNILVISWRANRLRNDATLEELKKITSFYEKLLS